jgi:hypothetical protein
VFLLARVILAWMASSHQNSRVTPSHQTSFCLKIIVVNIGADGTKSSKILIVSKLV